MENFVHNVIDRILDRQVKPKEECRSHEERIERLEDKREGRTLRAVIAGVLAAPAILWPVSGPLQSTFNALAEVTSSDNPIMDGTRLVPQYRLPQVTESNSDISDLWITLGKGTSFVLGLGLAGFAFNRARAAKSITEEIKERNLQNESDKHRYYSGNATSPITAEVAP